MLNRKAQSTLEYVIILTAIIAVILIVAGGVLRTSVEKGLNSVTNKMENKVSSISTEVD